MKIKEIAEKAGVSIGTVDRVLHNRGRVADKTKQKILEIIKESNYTQNLFASNLANSQKQIVIAVVMPHLEQDSAYWGLIKDGIDKAALELKGLKVEIELLCFDRFSEKDFKRVYKKALKSNIDGVFMAPVIAKAAQECFSKNPLNIPVALFDSDLPEVNRLFFIGQNSYQGGQVGGKLLHLLTGGTGDVAVTRMLPEGYHINDRVKGFKSYFNPFKTVKVHEFEINYKDHEKNIAIACKKMLEKVPELKGLFITNGNTHHFAEAMKISSRGKNINIVGFDLVDKNCEYLKKNMIDFLISQNPERQAFEGLILLARTLVFKEKCKKQYIVPLDILTKENLSNI